MLFIGPHSGLWHIRLQESITLLQTLEAKILFEAYIWKHGVKVSHYHADNGCFSDNLFLEQFMKTSQSFLYYGFTIHFEEAL